MPMWQKLNRLWRNLARKQKVEGDLDAELRSYREMLEDEKARAGADARTARREAMLELGGVEQIKEEVRDIRIGVLSPVVRQREATARQLVVRDLHRPERRDPPITIDRPRHAGAATSIDPRQ